jgi:hypothetical protein
MTKEVATKDDSQLPAYLQNMSGPAKDDSNFGADDIVLPQVKLLQGTSDQIGVFDSAKPGDFWFTGLDEALGPEVDFIIVSRKRKYLLSAPMDDGQGILARADDATTWDRTGSWEVQVDKKTKVKWEITSLDVKKSGLAEWGTYDPTDERSPPAATIFYEYLIILPDFPEYGPMVMSLARSAIKYAKKMLNSKISLHLSNGRPMQAIRFRMKTATEQNDSGQDYFVPQFYGSGFATEEQYNWALRLGEELGDYKVQDEGQIDEPVTDDEDDGAY